MAPCDHLARPETLPDAMRRGSGMKLNLDCFRPPLPLPEQEDDCD